MKFPTPGKDWAKALAQIPAHLREPTVLAWHRAMGLEHELRWRAPRSDTSAADVASLMRKHGIEPASMKARVEAITRLRSIVEALRSSGKRRRMRPSVTAVARMADQLLRALGDGGELLVDMQQSDILDPAGTLWRLRSDLAAISRLRPGNPAKGRGVDVTTVTYLGEIAEVYEQIAGRSASAAKSQSSGETRWSPFIRFATDCFSLAGRSATESALTAAWGRARDRVREARQAKKDAAGG